MIGRLPVAIVLVVACGIAIAGPGLRLGEPPPDLTIGSYVPAEDAIAGGWDELRGEVVMLEFWTTWCAGCVAALPHMNRLVSELQDEPFRLITVSNEEPRQVLDFLRARQLRSLLAFDSGNRTTEAYGVGCYPLAVLVGPGGRVRAITNPQNVTPGHIRKLLAGEDVALPLLDPATGEPARDASAAAPAARAAAPSLGIRIEPNPDKKRPMMLPPDHGVFSADAYSLRLLVATAHDVGQWFEVDYRLPASDTVYRVEVTGVAGEAARTILREAVMSTFDIRTSWEERAMDVFVLRSDPGLPAPKRSPSRAQESTGMATPAGLQLQGASMRKVAALLSNMVLDTLVIDETGLEGAHDLDASWSRGDLDSLQRALEECGLRLAPERRSIRILVVEPKG